MLLVLGGLQLILHGLLFGSRQLFQVTLGDLVAASHLLAHQLADVTPLLLAQVEILEHPRTVSVAVSAVAAAVVRAAFGHGHGQRRQGQGEQQGGESLAHHGVSPCLDAGQLPDVPSLGRSRSRAVRQG
ncbi:hypothetical protein D9M68_961250 [compost metagenome]